MYNTGAGQVDKELLKQKFGLEDLQNQIYNQVDQLKEISNKQKLNQFEQMKLNVDNKISQLENKVQYEFTNLHQDYFCFKKLR